MSEAVEPKLDQVQETLRTRVLHSSAHFAELERLFPGSYPRVLVRGEGAYVVDDHGRRLLDGGVRLEWMFLVTPDGNEVLSPYEVPWELDAAAGS